MIVCKKMMLERQSFRRVDEQRLTKLHKTECFSPQRRLNISSFTVKNISTAGDSGETSFWGKGTRRKSILAALQFQALRLLCIQTRHGALA